MAAVNGTDMSNGATADEVKPDLLCRGSVTLTRAPGIASTTQSQSPATPPSSSQTLGSRRKPVPTPRSTMRRPSLSPAPSPRASRALATSSALVAVASTSETDSAEESSGQARSAAPRDRKQSNGADSTCSNGNGEAEEDFLAALEKIPGVGSLRSVSACSGSLPSLGADPRLAVRREDSSHSLGSQSSSAQFSLRSTDVDLVKEAMRRERSLRLHSYRARERKDGRSEETSSSPSSPSASDDQDRTGSKKSAEALEMTSAATTSLIARCTERIATSPTKAFQSRPLPDLPRAHFEEEIVSAKGSSYSPPVTPDHYAELLSPRAEVRPSSATSASASTSSPESFSLLGTSQGQLTLTGTMRRSRRRRGHRGDGGDAGEISATSTCRSERVLCAVEMSVTQREMTEIEKRVHDKLHDRWFCGVRRGAHVLVLSVLILPVMLVYATLQAFYLGTLTWYNVFLHYNEERSCCHKLLSPLVLLIYPLWIAPVTLLLGVYGSLAQLSWYLDSWLECVRHPDRGFFAYVCNLLDIPDSCPYQVVLLTSPDQHYSHHHHSDRPPTGASVL